MQSKVSASNKMNSSKKKKLFRFSLFGCTKWGGRKKKPLNRETTMAIAETWKCRKLWLLFDFSTCVCVCSLSQCVGICEYATLQPKAFLLQSIRLMSAWNGHIVRVRNRDSNQICVCKHITSPNCGLPSPAEKKTICYFARCQHISLTKQPINKRQWSLFLSV